jgi:hypothetical protein
MRRKWTFVLTALFAVIAVLSAAAVLAPEAAAADPTVIATGKCGENLTYEIKCWSGSNPTYQVLISGTGDMYDYSEASPAPWKAYAANLTSVHITGATSIGAYAFDGCASAAVYFSQSETSIGECAFRECKLYSLVAIPDSVVSIGADAFMNCSGIDEIHIGKNVQTIAPGAFRLCSSLTEINVASNNTSFEMYQYALYSKDHTELLCFPKARAEGKRTLPYQFNPALKKIDDYACEDCEKLGGPLQLPAGLESIGRNAFSSCSALTGALTLPDSLTSIGQSAFALCTGFSSLTVPGSVTQIPQYAFADMRMLASAELSDGILSIGDYAFRGCSVLPEIAIPTTVASVGTQAFALCPALSAAYFEGNSPSSGSDPFNGCASSFAVYYLKSCTGWTAPSWNGYPDDVIAGLSVFQTPEKDVYYPGDRPDTWGLVLKAEFANGHIRLIKSRFLCTPGNLQSPGRQSVTASYGGFSSSYSVTVLETGAVVTQGDVGTLHWSIDANGVFFISGSGPMTGTPWKTPDSNLKLIKTICIGTGVTSIAKYAFSGCTNAAGSLLIPGSVTAINSYAFSGCQSLSAAAIPGSVKTIGDSAFQTCSGLRGTLELQEGLQSIGITGFGGCSSVVKVHIPASVTTIGGDAFSGLSSLTEFEVAEGGNNFVSQDGILYKRDFYTGVINKLLCVPIAKKIHNFTVPDTVTDLQNAFCGCTNITGYIKVPTAGYFMGTFRNCTGVESIILSEGSVTIGSYAFENCTSLTSVTIPASVTNIGQGIFKGCSRLKAVFFRRMTAPAFADQYSFSGCAEGLRVYYPEGATGWDVLNSMLPTGGQCLSFPASAISTVNCEFAPGAVPSDVALSFPDGLDPSGCTIFLAYYSADGRLLGIRSADARNAVYPLDIAGYSAARVKVLTVNSNDDMPQAPSALWALASN